MVQVLSVMVDFPLGLYDSFPAAASYVVPGKVIFTF